MAITAAQLLTLKSHGLVRSYGVNENGVDPCFNELKRWIGQYGQLTFFLQQLGWLPVLYHICLAWVLHGG